MQVCSVWQWKRNKINLYFRQSSSKLCFKQFSIKLCFKQSSLYSTVSEGGNKVANLVNCETSVFRKEGKADVKIET